MRELFGCEAGLSDHTLGIGTAIAAVAHGASVIEKHFTLSRADGGVDSAFSMEPDEFRMLVEETKRAWQSLGCVQYGPGEDEEKSVVFRRSLYVAEDMQAGDFFTKENLRSIRPGMGLAPKYNKVLLSKRVNRDVRKGTAVSWKMVG